ncbi:MAG: hypothetical protein ABI568_14130 [Pseudarthrobacter sp.]
MTTPSEDPQNAADLRGPGDPDKAAKAAGQSGPEAGRAANIREEQQTQAAGTVPASYVGSGDPDQERKPEDALGEPGTWDDEV